VEIEFELNFSKVQLKDGLRMMDWKPLDAPTSITIEEGPPEGLPSGLSIACMDIRQTPFDSPPPSLDRLTLSDSSTLKGQRSAARLEEHAAGRATLAHLMLQSGCDPAQHLAERDEAGRPVLRPPSVAFSIAHDSRLAIAAIADPEWSIGIDLEPIDRTYADGVIDWIATGAERESISSGTDSHRLDAWLAKEASCKAVGASLSETAKKAIWHPSDCMVIWSADSDGEGAPINLIHRTIESRGAEHRFCLAWRST